MERLTLDRKQAEHNMHEYRTAINMMIELLMDVRGWRKGDNGNIRQAIKVGKEALKDVRRNSHYRRPEDVQDNEEQQAQSGESKRARATHGLEAVIDECSNGFTAVQEHMAAGESQCNDRDKK